MPKTQVTTSIETPKPSILMQSGLDVTLDNIDKHLESIDKKLNDTPTRERVDTLERELRDAQHDMDQKIERLSKERDAEIEQLRQEKASQEAFETVRKIVYGFVGIILIAFASGLVYLVFNK